MPEFNFDSLNAPEVKENKLQFKILSMSEDNIQVEHIFKGGNQIANYRKSDYCMTCERQEYGSSESGSCVICDKIMTIEDLEEFKIMKKEDKKPLKPSEIKEKIKANTTKKPFENTHNLQKSQDALSKMKSIDAIKLISEATGLTKEEIDVKCKEKQTELKGLLSYEGAIFIIGNEFGIDFSKTKSKTDPTDTFGDLALPDIKTPPPNKEYTIEATIKKAQPKITKTKPEINKNDQYPLVTIDIKEENKLTLSEAKQKVLNDIELYNFTISNIVNEKDFASIQGKKFLCKSGVRKIQLALGISTKIIREQTFKDDKQWVSKFIVKAIAPNGRYATSIGVCEQNEKGRARTLHDTIAMAQTRATSRAILDLVGFGAVSAGEIDDSKDSVGDVLNDFGGK